MEIFSGLFILVFLLFILAIPFILLAKLFANKHEEQEEKQYLPYHAKRFFFTCSEQEFFNELHAQLDKSEYTVFPKVRLGDFIEVDHYDRRDRTWWNKIRAKHVDYLIWSLTENRIVLAIELDGSSHNSPITQKRDDFVNGLYEKVGIKLERVRVGTSFASEVQQITQTLKA